MWGYTQSWRDIAYDEVGRTYTTNTCGKDRYLSNLRLYTLYNLYRNYERASRRMRSESSSEGVSVRRQRAKPDRERERETTVVGHLSAILLWPTSNTDWTSRCLSLDKGGVRSLGVPWGCKIRETINHNIRIYVFRFYIFLHIFHDFSCCSLNIGTCVFTFFAYVFLVSFTSVHVNEINLHTYFHLHVYLFDFCSYFDSYVYTCVNLCVRVCVSMCFPSMFVCFQYILANPSAEALPPAGSLAWWGANA